ncbi:MAG: hypothetical protein WEE89_09000 [Gemmatimonadota bacterium]
MVKRKFGWRRRPTLALFSVLLGMRAAAAQQIRTLAGSGQAADRATDHRLLDWRG